MHPVGVDPVGVGCFYCVWPMRQGTLLAVDVIIMYRYWRRVRALKSRSIEDAIMRDARRNAPSGGSGLMRPDAVAAAQAKIRARVLSSGSGKLVSSGGDVALALEAKHKALESALTVVDFEAEPARPVYRRRHA